MPIRTYKSGDEYCVDVNFSKTFEGSLAVAVILAAAAVAVILLVLVVRGAMSFFA